MKLCEIVYKTHFRYFPATVCPQDNCSIQPCQGDFNIKIYYSGGKGVVMSTSGVADRNFKIGLIFTV